ncbi:hypothetical protein OF001_U300011 [Pseudomonas sp. OF001]|nr:hypothetical protein OF001_U300011 [Pseudomonas sp. OF001]
MAGLRCFGVLSIFLGGHRNAMAGGLIFIDLKLYLYVWVLLVWAFLGFFGFARQSALY